MIPTMTMAQVWTLDKAHSQVNFSVSHLVVAEVTGGFNEFDVTFETTKEDFSDANITASIRTASIDTENEKRDGHLRADDFLNAEKFPLITFKSTGIEKTGDGRFNVTGDLTIRDVTKPVVLDMQFKGTIKDPWGGTRAGFRATTTINRFDYGVKWDAAVESGGLVAGKDVEITLLIEFIR
jgi:polyisoprenoid-binding protein YceI